MTPELEIWLKQATRCLSADSAAQVRREIEEHYEAARENQGDRAAIAALGSAKAANREYRKVLLLKSEAQILQAARWESRNLRCRPGVAWILRLLPAALASAAGIAFATGHVTLSRMVLAAAIVAGIGFAVPTFPIYTPMRGRVYRYAKWIAFIGAGALAAGPSFLTWSQMVLSVGGYMAWMEVVHYSIRRKLPVAQWPKTLYL